MATQPSKNGKKSSDSTNKLESTEAHMNPLRIIVAEDDSVTRLFYKIVLEQLGYEPKIVNNGKDLLEEIGPNDFDIAFIDLNLPYVNGYQILERVDPLKKPWMVMVSSSEFAEDHALCLKLGANDFIRKPFNKEEIEKAIKIVKQRAITLPIESHSVLTPSRNQNNNLTKGKGLNSIDLNHLLKEYDYNVKLLLHALRETIQICPELINEIHEAFLDKKYGLMEEKAHQLKNRCAAFHIKMVVEVARDLEIMSRNHLVTGMDEKILRMKKEGDQLQDLLTDAYNRINNILKII